VRSSSKVARINDEGASLIVITERRNTIKQNVP
jgi:hypothetical protein